MKKILSLLVVLSIGSTQAAMANLSTCENQAAVAAYGVFRASQIKNVRPSTLGSAAGYGYSVLNEQGSLIMIKVSNGEKSSIFSVLIEGDRKSSIGCEIASVTRQ